MSFPERDGDSDEASYSGSVGDYVEGVDDELDEPIEENDDPVQAPAVENVVQTSSNQASIQELDYSKLNVWHVIALPPRHPAYFIIGRKGFGKSALVEMMGEIYWWLRYVILDWNGAFDLESLHWCIKGGRWRDKNNKWHEGYAYPILVIHPANVYITTNNRLIQRPDTKETVEAVKLIPDTTPLEDIILQAHQERRIVVFSIYLYKDPAKGQYKLADMIKALPEVMRDKIPQYVHCAMLLRELADVASNKMKTHGGTGERETKRGLSWFFRQARHARTTIIADMQNPDDIYGAIEAQEDYILIKRLNKHHIPKKLQWVVEDIKAKRAWAARHYILNRFKTVSIDRLAKNNFYCVWPEGHFTLEQNRMPRFRHHQVKDNALAMAGISTPKQIVAPTTGKTTEQVISDIQAKKKAKEDYLAKLNRAVEVYLTNKKVKADYSWQDCAADPDVKFIGQDKKAAGDTLAKQIHRYGRAGKLTKYDDLRQLKA